MKKENPQLDSYLEKQWSNWEETESRSLSSGVFLIRVFVLFLSVFWIIFPVLQAEAWNQVQQRIIVKATNLLSKEFKPSKKEIALTIRVMRFLPKKHYKLLKNITFDYNKKESPRGQANLKNIIINRRSEKIDDAEFVAVLIHEFGHIADLGFLRKSLRGRSDGFKFATHDDPSLQFYTSSWQNDTTKNVPRKSFISRYAQSSPYEDFAESYIFFILHNKEFKKRAQNDKVLQEKYDFLFTDVFDKHTYSYEQKDTFYPENFFDTTVLNYNFPKFMQDTQIADFEETEDNRTKRQRRSSSKGRTGGSSKKKGQGPLQTQLRKSRQNKSLQRLRRLLGSK